MSAKGTTTLILAAVAALGAGWLLVDKYLLSSDKFTDKQTAMNYLFLIGKGDPQVMQGMDAGYVIARANAVHDGSMTFPFNGKSYNTATGYGV